MTKQPELDRSQTPASAATEKTILGAILLDNRAYDDAEQITYNDFYLSSHRTIFGRMAAMISEGNVVDTSTLAQELSDHRELDSIGGRAYLFELTEMLPRHLALESYVRIVKEKSQLRTLISVCHTTIAMAEDQSVSIDDLLTDTDTRLMEISAENDAANTETLAEASEREFLRIEAERASGKNFIGIPSGLSALDTYVGGWVEGELAIIAGKPGQGKSSALIQTLIQCGHDGVPAHIFSPEMTKGQILRRMWAAVASLRFSLLTHPIFLHGSDMSLLRDVKATVAGWPLVIDDDTNITPGQLISRARISKRRNGTRLFGVDYLQKMKFLSKPEHRHIEVSDTAVKLANLAKKEHVAVVALSSLTDKGGRTRNAVPTLGDLRQSGDIQYEASTVVFIHRETAEASEEIKSDGLMIIPKQRNGKTGQFDVTYNEHLMFEAGSPHQPTLDEQPHSSSSRVMQYALPHKNDEFD